MTSRLKRKLNDLGVDTSSAKATENFCLIGTPLPPLEKSKDTGEFVPLWKQDVRDEKGRRRLHGAFTGGFSAGYFNTVGSKEGWTPSTFVSSRSDRAKQKAARPEDFMDEEDLAELRDSQKLVDVNEEVDFLGGTQAELQKNEPEKDSVVQALEATLLPPAKDSVGARILRKMGWRMGQGIGPRVTWEKRKEQEVLYSDAMSTKEDIHEEDDEEAKKHLYPPRDSKVPVYPRKDNSFGLGYTPGLGLTDIVSGSTIQSTKSSGPNLSAGFGLGALNDAEDDDLDVYDGGVNMSSNKLAYDEVPEDDERVLISSRRQTSSTNNRSRDVNVHKSSSIQVFHDGRPVLQGFVLSAKPVTEDKLYPLPQVPKDWSPNPKRVWQQNKENLGDLDKDGEATATKPTRTGWRNEITAEQRGTLLGETPLPAAPRSVFDYLAPKDRERLKNMATGLTGPSTAAPGPHPDSEPVSLSVPKVEPHIAKAALHGFQPFVSDPVKQSRYTAFLQAHASMEEDLPFSQLPGQSRLHFNKELEDYAKAAQIFKPVSGSMASRFTSAAVWDLKPQTQEGLHTPSTISKEHTSAESETQEEKQREENPKEHAARVGMYGPLTREIKIWIPAKLLCKRFGVKDPNPEPLDDNISQNMPSSSTSNWKPDEEPSMKADTTIGEHNEDGSTTKQIKRPTLANIGLGDDETQGQDVLTYERPTRDIFKAIFASDDEDSDDNNKDEENENDMTGEQSEANNGVVSNNEIKDNSPNKNSSGMIPASEVVNTVQDTQQIDFSIFKPTFVPRSDREKRKDGTKDKTDNRKEKKKKHGKTALVSFDVDEDGSEARTPMKEKDPSKRKKKKKEQSADDDEGMWIEKAPPEGLSELTTEPAPSAPTLADDEGVKDIGPSRGRKRAIDFL